MSPMRRVEVDKATERLTWDIRGTIIMEILDQVPAWVALTVLSQLFAKKLEDVPEDERSSYVGKLLEGLGPMEGITKLDLTKLGDNEPTH